MKILRKSSENEMIALFLSGEIKSERWGKLLRSKNLGSIVTHPDLQNNNENEIRKQLLKENRGYDNNTYLFVNFPKVVNWNWAILDKADILKIRYIEDDFWKKLSNGTRYAKDTVENIKNNKEIYIINNNEKELIERCIEISKCIKNGIKPYPLIIVVPLEKMDQMIVLEGHTRLTGINLAIEYASEIEVIIGFAEEEKLSKWQYY